MCVAFTCETHAGVLMESETDRLIFYSSTGLTFTSGNINQLQEITEEAKCYLAAGSYCMVNFKEEKKTTPASCLKITV